MDSLVRRIMREGPLPFGDFMDEALYGSDGFYARGGGAGRGRDFLTSPEVGSMFGSVLAQALDTWWDDADRPDPYLVADVGAGPGSLARAVMQASPRCARALRYLLVDRAAPMRQLHRTIGLPVEEATTVLGDIDVGIDADGESARTVRAGQGPICASLERLPDVDLHVVIANELLDNIAVDLYEKAADEWREIRVSVDGSGEAAELCECLVAAPPHVAERLDALAPDASPGARVPLQDERAKWLRAALAASPGGRVVVFDYARSTDELAGLPWRQWLRTYRSHGRGGHPLEHAGDADITVDVATDQLAAVRTPALDRSQAEFLRAHGIESAAAEQRRIWEAGASRGDLASLAARSRAQELAALCEEDGLGGFRVLEWQG